MAEVFRPHAEGIDLFVRLTPKAAKDAIEGIEETADGRAHLKARVRAVPEKGAANHALEKLVAKAFGMPTGSVRMVAGGTSRLKTLRIIGDTAKLAEAIARIAAT
ncbi:DUF167 family protein [Mesorhizobium sp. 1B3]|uniref:DUF167 family protein n=1 Tax=Mesorhizobium sp. 1B3 TaxID=3243599 RepID=UPI003D9669C7